MEKIRIKIHNETNSGRRRGWTKHVTSVDTSKTNGYAFDGEFIPDGKEVELPVGAIIVQCNPEGSVKNSWKSGVCSRLKGDGTLTRLHEDAYDWRDDFLSFRDLVDTEINKTHPIDRDALKSERETLVARINEINQILGGE